MNLLPEQRSKILFLCQRISKCDESVYYPLALFVCELLEQDDIDYDHVDEIIQQWLKKFAY